jgi:hypothetical protein
MQDWRDVTVWERLAAEGHALVAAAEASLAPGKAIATPAAIARLRKTSDAALVAAAFELVAARRRARAKFAAAETLWCDVAGVEQASDELVAAWKAARVAAAVGPGAAAVGPGAAAVGRGAAAVGRGAAAVGPGAAVLDLCSGIGGDAMALSAAGLAVTAVDRDARRAWMTARNARCHTLVDDVEAIDLAGAVLHVDPARREERSGVRAWSIDDYQPGRDWILRAIQESRAAAIKLSPAADRRSFPVEKLEWEFVEVDGTLVQAIIWAGEFATTPGIARATVLRSGCAPCTLSGLGDDMQARALPVDSSPAPGAWINEPCAALERARLLTSAVGSVAAWEIGGGVGLLLSEEPLRAPWFESFVVIGTCEAKQDAILRVIASAGLKARSVRVRGQAADADRLTRDLGCHPSGTAVVFLWREQAKPRALVARAV